MSYEPHHRRWTRLLRLLVILATFGIVAGATASVATAVPPRPEPEPGEPPEVVRPPFRPPANGFTWRVAGRFGSTIVDPDEPDTPPLVNYHYCAPERPNVNCFGNVADNQYHYDDAWVHPSALKTTFDGCPTAEEREAAQTEYLYTWEVFDKSTETVLDTIGPLARCRLTHDMTIDPNTGSPMVSTGVRLTITDPSSPTPIKPILGSPFAQAVNPHDYLIVSIGDSYGSGEGNPDVPQRFATGPGGIPLPWVERGPRWEDKRCHRSATAGPAQAALQLEGSDSHSSVTFISFACSGANIKMDAFDGTLPWDPYAGSDSNKGAGILTEYAGTEPPGGNAADRLPTQIDQVEEAVDERKIDALVMSGGGNDIGFANIATVCVFENLCALRPVTASAKAQAEGWAVTTLDARVHDDLEALNGIYDELAQELDGSELNVGKFLVTEYPDSTRGLFGLPCPAILDDVLPLHTAMPIAALLTWLGVLFPWVGAGLLAGAVATGVMPPFAMDLGETMWAGDTVLPSGGSNADHGLDRVIADAVARHDTENRIPWELVGGITEDFQGTGARSGGHGHGYCAPDSWIRSATDATNMQGPYVPAYALFLHNQSTGTLHPNAVGHADYAAHIFEHLAGLLPEPPPVGGPGGAPELFVSDTNSVDNSTTKPDGTPTVSSRHGSNGWLIGCEPTGAGCPESSALAVEQIVGRVNPNTTVRGAGLTINGTAVDCSTGQGLPSGVTCQQTLFPGEQLFKWSLQFAADGIYRLHANFSGQDESLASTDREVKVDLHDPLTPQASADSGDPPTNGWHRSAVTVTFDIADPGDGGSPFQGVGLEGIQYELDGAAPVLVRAQSQLPPEAPIEQAQAQVTGDGIHTLVYRAVDVGGRTSPDVTMPIKIDHTAPTVSVVKPAAASYTLNQPVAANYSCSDTLSGVAGCDGTRAVGEQIDTATTGAKTFTVHATDSAGNVSDQSVTYQVGFGVRALYDEAKAHKAGSTIPIKLQLVDVNGVNQSAASIVVSRASLVKIDNTATSAVDPATASTADADFRYEPGTASYHYNLKTTGLTTGTWQLNFTTSADGVSHSVRFDIR